MENLNVLLVNYDGRTYNYSYTYELEGEKHSSTFSSFDKLSENEMNETARMEVDMYLNY